jgi:hypothetical protein
VLALVYKSIHSFRCLRHRGGLSNVSSVDLLGLLAWPLLDLLLIYQVYRRCGVSHCHWPLLDLLLIYQVYRR